jgi:hypothetical protein
MVRQFPPLHSGRGRQAMFQQFREELQGSQHRHRPQSTNSEQRRSSSREDPGQEPDDHAWDELLVDLPLAPELPQATVSKIFKLAEEVKRRAQVITAGRDLHDTHMILYLIGHWDALQPQARHYASPEVTLRGDHQRMARGPVLRSLGPRQVS